MMICQFHRCLDAKNVFSVTVYIGEVVRNTKIETKFIFVEKV